MMFLKIFTTRIKCIFRCRSLIFWTLLFPIILATMFHFAFSGFDTRYSFQPIKAAMVNNEEFKNDSNFKTVLESVSKEDGDSTHLFDITYCSKSEAEQLLKNSRIEGYFDYDGEPKLVVKQTGSPQSTMKAFLDQYKQSKSSYTSIIKENPKNASNVLALSINGDDYVKEVSATNAKPNLTLIYYYALIAMACLFGGSLGINEINAIQANQSPQGARLNIAPVPKSKLFFASISAATAIQFACNIVLLLFLKFVLNIDFGSRVPLIVLAIAVASLTGVSFGALLGAVIKAGEKVKTAVHITASLTLCFLSGLMLVDMKQIVATNAPLLAAVNPANIITDTFYSLYFYGTLDRYFTNILSLLAISSVFYVIVYFVMRRQRYESI